MVDFLVTEEINNELRKIIEDAQDRLWIISPYLKINDRLKERLQDKNNLNFDTDITVIYGKNDLRPEENEWLDSMESINIFFRKNLHAKCYLNEKEALLTSMNLYEFSQVNNDEMGLLVSKEKEPDLYGRIFEECKRIIRMSEGIRLAVSTVKAVEEEPQSPTRQVAKTTVGKPQAGFCIRCGVNIDADPTKPYCLACYRSWNRHKNADYEEQDGHCHICSSGHKASMNKPLCRSCYQKYRNVFEFAGV